ncbi:hypothetical protein ACHAXN_003750 [Cyclotella atomus]
MKTRDLGLRFKPDPTSGFECYCGADFAGNGHNRLQSQVALSTTEAEYIALSTALRDTKCAIAATKWCAKSQSSIARSSRTTLVPWNLLVCLNLNFGQGPSTSTCAIITFVSTFGRVSSRSFLSVQTTRLQTL